MVRFRQWMRTRVACYGAAIAIILEQLDAFPRSTVVENPNPLVRIREQPSDVGDWHPDELITRCSGRQYVLVWDQADAANSARHSRMLHN